LRELRPRGVPAVLGVGSENAAHRAAIEWDDPSDSGRREGVFIFRRDSNSILNVVAGGRLFPGVHHHARFNVCETEDRFELDLDSDEGAVHVQLGATVSSNWPSGSVFSSLADASAFFEAGSLGYSPTRDGHSYDGLELHSFGWRVEPLSVDRVES